MDCNYFNYLNNDYGGWEVPAIDYTIIQLYNGMNFDYAWKEVFYYNNKNNFYKKRVHTKFFINIMIYGMMLGTGEIYQVV